MRKSYIFPLTSALILSFVLLTACQAVGEDGGSASSPADQPTGTTDAAASSQLTEEQGTLETPEDIQHLDTPAIELCPAYQDECGTVFGEYYTLSLPASWDGNYIMECTEMTGHGYSAAFFRREDYLSGHGGFLFSIDLFLDTEDYSYLPSYDVLGSISVYRIGTYNIVVCYPTDVQFAEENLKQYDQMKNDIPEILQSIRYDEECEFSETPIEVESVSPLLDESLSTDFYAELCTFL